MSLSSTALSFAGSSSAPADTDALRSEHAIKMRRGLLVLQVLYLIVAYVLLAGTLGGVNISVVFVCVAVVALWKTKRVGFIIDISMVPIVISCYEGLRAAATHWTKSQIHAADIAAVERCLFGMIPSAWLQAHLNYPALGVVCDFVYGTHYVYPIVLAAVLWHKRKDLYWPYMIGLLGMTYLGFVCFLLFPAAPPWWASHFGIIPEKVLPYTLSAEIMLKTPNPVAAFPSLHGAYSAYFLVFCCWAWGRRGLWALPLSLSVAFATVFLGHHYIVDLLAGYALATASFMACYAFVYRASWSAWQPQLKNREDSCTA